MTLWRDISLAMAALLAAALCSAQWLAHPNDLPSVCFPLVVLVSVFALPHLVRVRGFTLVAAVLFFAIVLDEKSYPFNEWDPVTERLGPLLFDNFSALMPLPGLHLTPFEFLSVVLGVGCAFVKGRSEVENFLRNEHFRVLILLAALIPLAATFAVFYGQATSGSLRIAMTQIRTLPIMGLWIYLGYVACEDAADVETLFKVVLVGTLVKAVQGWWAFFVVYGGVMGRREYLIEHLTSEHLVIAMLVVGLVWDHRRRHVWHDALALGLGVILFFPYLLNERRASFIGVFLTLVFVPVVYYRKMRSWYVRAAAALALALTLFIAATWNVDGLIGTPARLAASLIHKDEGEIDYRDVENFNHYSGIMDRPILGQGFGHRLKMVIELTDISSVYALYDVLPHNNVLWIWCNAGPLGMAALGTLMAFGIAVLVRLGKTTRDPRLALLAFVGFGMIIRWLVYAYADLGFIFFRLTALLGLVIGMGVRYYGQSSARLGGARVVP